MFVAEEPPKLDLPPEAEAVFAAEAVELFPPMTLATSRAVAPPFARLLTSRAPVEPPAFELRPDSAKRVPPVANTSEFDVLTAPPADELERTVDVSTSLVDEVPACAVFSPPSEMAG